jgi:hypothetical protein
MTFLDTDVIRVLEEILPARFGGGPADYQLVEDERADGQPCLRLVGDLDEEERRRQVLGRGDVASRSQRKIEEVIRPKRARDAVQPEVRRCEAIFAHVDGAERGGRADRRVERGADAPGVDQRDGRAARVEQGERRGNVVVRPEDDLGGVERARGQDEPAAAKDPALARGTAPAAHADSLAAFRVALHERVALVDDLAVPRQLVQRVGRRVQSA